jgi:tetratricopeptide (TPR) repeat protein
MSSKDIEKLKDKFQKDPNSKLFLPLAEEYRKEGMLDEAVEVLQGGVERHPSYTSARVLLGKIYLEKGMLDEAKREFEHVIATVPDNLFAQKKLAEIYRDTGETELAMKAFRSILKLNPMDEEALNRLKDVEAAVSPPEPAKEPADQGPLPVELHIREEAADTHMGEEISIEPPDIKAEHSEDDLNSFKDFLFGDKAAMGDETEEAAEITIPEEEVVAGEENFSFRDVVQQVGGFEAPLREEPAPSAAEEEETIDLVEEPFDLDEIAGTAFEEPLSEAGRAAADLSDADGFVAAGQLSAAMDAYRKCLSSDPDNKTILQRMEELRALLKLMGKDKEVLIGKLDAFLEGINKRRDEFFGRT